MFRLSVTFPSGPQTLTFATALTRLLAWQAFDAVGLSCEPDDRPADVVAFPTAVRS